MFQIIVGIGGFTLLSIFYLVRWKNYSDPVESLVLDEIAAKQDSVKELETQTSYGPVRGFRSRQGVDVYRGVPYAKAPIGPLRFKHAQEPEKWTELVGGSFGPRAPHREMAIKLLFIEAWKRIGMVSQWYYMKRGPFNQDPKNPEKFDDMIGEDNCLTLNINTPSGRHDNELLPVLFFVHGGSFISGSGCQALYNESWGAKFCLNQCVYVSINYRLGSSGFLKVKGGDYNNGLSDQIQALKFVHKEISKFGGDPNNITVFGESAGAFSVACLMACKQSSKLIRRAIVQSGSAHVGLPREHADVISGAFAEALGLNEVSVGALSNVSAEALVAAQNKVLARPRKYHRMPFQPCIDGDLLPKSPITLLQDGVAKHIDTIVGWTKHEMNLFLQIIPQKITDEVIEEVVRESIGSEHYYTLVTHADSVNETHKEVLKLLRDPANGWSPKEQWSALLTCIVFSAPSSLIAGAQRKAGANVFVYRFDHCNAYGAMHAIELPFVFGTYETYDRFPYLKGLSGNNGVANVAALSDDMLRRWCAFARDGRPNVPKLAEWPKFELNDRKAMIFDSGEITSKGVDGVEDALLKRLIELRRESETNFGGGFLCRNVADHQASSSSKLSAKL